VRSGGRTTINIRVDVEKLSAIDRHRSAGFGIAETHRQRSDILNELLGYGLQVYELKQDLGEREFVRLWRIIQSMDLKRLNLERIEQMTRKS
jgi:hypothetical protein